jgi:exosome complex component RRP42
MDAAGNLLDCAVMTTRAALYNTRIPKTDIQDLGDGDMEFEVDDDVEDAEPLQGWENLPMSVTLFKIGNRYVIDPTILEELCSQVTLTVGVNKDGSVCGIQKGSNGSIDPSLLTEMIQVNIYIEPKTRFNQSVNRRLPYWQNL